MAQREHWGSKLGFVLATAGSAIGLGSLWRFPYIAGQNGGGAFVLLYLISTFLIAIPVFIAELIMGRKAQKSAVLGFSNLSNQSEKWRLVGWFNILTSFLILSYYCVISGWTVNYTLMCLNNFTEGKTPNQIREVFDTLYVSGDINLFWNFIFVLLSVGVVFGGIRKGIEYWSKILTPALFIILIALFIFATTLPGFGKAVEFLLYPDFSKLTSQGILDALGMSFFTLSVGIGIILTYGSYLKSSDDIPKTGITIGLISLLVSLFASLMIFPIIFTFGLNPEEGAGLVFKTLPVLFAQLPGTVVISTVFFILFVFTTLTSSISLLEVLVSNLMEVANWNRKKSVLISGASVFIMGIPSALAGSGSLFAGWKEMYGKDFLGTIDYLTGSWMMPLGGFLVAIFVGWTMGKKVIKEEFVLGTSLSFLLPVWLILLRYVAPVAVLLVILQKGEIIDVTSLIKT